MSTEIKPELSEKNKYYIPKHRYYELLHFCRQYTDYLTEKENILNTCVRPYVAPDKVKATVTFAENLPTEKWAMKLADIDDKIQLIEQATVDADKELSGYILMAVSGGIGYDILSIRYNIPCSRNTFYDRYRKFFWILDQRRR